MKVISTIEELKNYVSASASFKYDKLAPHIQRTVITHIKELLGEEFLQDISAAYQAALDVINEMTPVERAEIIAVGDQYKYMPTKYHAIMPYLQDAVANISFMNCISQMQMTIGADGIRLAVNENQKTAFQWQIDDLKYQLASDGYTALNHLLETLDANIDDFPVWAGSKSYEAQKKYFVHNPGLFNEAYYISNSRITYVTLRYIMYRVEQFDVKTAIGEKVYKDLKEVSHTAYSDKQKNLVYRFLVPGIVLLTIARGIRERAIEVTDLGVSTNLYTYYATLKDARKKYHHDKERESMIEQLENDGNEFLKAAKDYIDANKEEFGVTEEEDARINFRINNRVDRGFFGM